PDQSGDDEKQEQFEQPASDHLPAVPVPAPVAAPAPVSGCACFNVSSACFAARPSGESGAISTTFCQASAAPARSCLPNAFTMPIFNIGLVCFGLILSEVSNCRSARSVWFV